MQYTNHTTKHRFPSQKESMKEREGESETKIGEKSEKEIGRRRMRLSMALSIFEFFFLPNWRLQKTSRRMVMREREREK